MADISIRHFSGSLRDTFRRYLFTQNFIADSERPLRDAFWTALQGPEVFCREPLLGAIPSYEPTRSLRELTARNEMPRLDARLNGLPSAVFDVDRKLYVHQEMSIGLVNRGRNVAVATGTGSGKTECFLLPVLDDALRNPGAGVRAIVVYPLNALANDQLARLRAMLQPLPSITFGRYTGDTPWRREDVSASDLADVLDPNERYSREELRAEPPHILLTNFAMLEYLLLRPQDNLLFAQSRLKYVVLDEAHSYSGAQGIDVALLIRRLKEAFPGRTLQFILTSATLGTDRARIARFAATLTGAEYEPADVVLGEPVSAFAAALGSPVDRTVYERIVPDDETMLRWYHALDSLQEMRHLVNESGLRVERIEGVDSVSRLLFEWLRDNAELDSLHRLASERPRTLAEASRLLFQAEDQSAQRVVEWLVILGAHAISSTSGQPLLPGRYHLFFRGLRGGTVCVASKCPQRSAHPETVWSHLMLEDRLHCAACEKAVLPLATCVHCGIPTVRIFELGDAWYALSPGSQATPRMLTWLDVGEEDDEPGADEADVHLCVSCNHISGTQNGGNCCAQPELVRMRALSTDQEGNVKECPSCGGVARPYPTVFRVFNTGEDASTAVLAEATVRVLPADNPSKPADGRRLLAFSDSRQRAAHFAPYLARTTAQTQYLEPVYEAIRQTAKALGGDGAPFDDIAARFVKNVVTQAFVVVRKTNDDDGEESTQIRRSTTLYAADKRELARECLVALFANFTSSPKVRNNISGLGLAFAEVELNPEQRRELPSRLPDLFKDLDEGWALIQTLLWPMVWRKALVLPDGIVSRQLTPGPEMVTFHYSEQGRIEGRQRWRWNSYLAISGRDNVIRRSQQVQALAGFLGLDAIADRPRIEATLEAVWVGFRDLDVIRQVRANEFQIPYERLLVRLGDQLFACRRCGSLAARSVKRRCLVPNCGGDLEVMSAANLALRFENHHWFHRVTATSPLPLEVREHTAQLTNEAGRQYQRAFMSGDVNVLSSSTTFEMGVDVGQLKSVFLRNVPPSPSNYVQRAGRAGRRKEGAAYAVTYARSIPHDQVHYHNPLAIVQGLVPVPRINLKNTRLTQRHINSFLLGAFLRSNGVAVPVALKTMSTEWFFLGATPVSGLFRPWLAAAGAALRSAITRIVAATGTLTPEAAFDAAAAGLDQCVAGLREKLDSYQAQHAELAAELAQAQGQERVRLARAMESVERLIEQTKQESLIDFLAASHWLPGYAFPQDVVRLLVIRG